MPKRNTTTQVLIIGAGPTGLVLALALIRMGIAVRIIDKTRGPGTTSRALVLHARTLEFYQQLGLAREVQARGLPFTAINFWVQGRKSAHIAFENSGRGLSPFPQILVFPQDEHELFLLDHLRQTGVEVERETELMSFTQPGPIDAQLKHPDGEIETCRAAYLAGCDGAHSTVRNGAGGGFSGTTYSHLFYVADVRADGPVVDKELHIGLDQADLLLAFPLKGEKRVRLIGTIDKDRQGGDLTWNDISRRPLDQLGIQVREVNWFSTYHVHHRVADHFRFGRAFLLGDAAHIHSPVGGQGMNTGIGDAVNLAWKLAAVLNENADEKILETYESERIGFARQLVATTDRAFTFITRVGPLARWIRMRIVPLVLPVLFRFHFIRRLQFRVISQIAIRYRASTLSAGRAGRVRGGDRLPWAGDNFEPLSSLKWQVHVYGRASAGQIRVCEELGLAMHVFPWHEAIPRAGFKQNEAYLVRPDGYVALAGGDSSGRDLRAYFENLKSPEPPRIAIVSQ